MPWTEAAHPRAPAGSASGGQFAATAGSQKTPAKKAAAKKTAAKRTAAKTVTVKSGDTLSAIARRNRVTLAQLKKDNPGLFTKAHRGGNLIFPGNKVKISAPAKKAAKKTTARKTARKRTTAKKTTARKRKS